MDNPQPEKDWDTEFSNSFTKKIPFPIFNYEFGTMNPTNPNIIYTFAKASIHESTKFQLFVQANVKSELDAIINELEEESKKNVPPAPAKNDNPKEDTNLEADLYNTGDNPPADPSQLQGKKDSQDIVEKAMMVLVDRKLNETSQKQMDSKKEEEKGKEDDLDEEDKQKDNAESNSEYINFMQVETKDTFGQNLKKCHSIITMWEVKSSGYRKIKEQFLFEPMSSSIEFSKDGKRMLLTHNDSQTLSIYDALQLNKISTFKLECNDDYGNPITYFYGTMLSFDGSYIIAGDSYTRRIFDINGKFVRNLSGRNMYTIYQYSKTEF